MARIAHPWFWAERNGWYVNKGGHRHFLGDHPPTAPRPRQIKGKWNAPEAIRTAFHALMSAKPAPLSPLNPVPESVAGLTLAQLFEKYLDWCQKHRDKRTYDGYLWHLQKFAAALSETVHMAAETLKPFHVVEWLDGNRFRSAVRVCCP